MTDATDAPGRTETPSRAGWIVYGRRLATSAVM